MTTAMLMGLGALALALLLFSVRRVRPSTPRRPVDSGGDPGFVPTDTGSDRDKPEGTDDGAEGGGGGDGGDAGGSDGGGGGD